MDVWLRLGRYVWPYRWSVISSLLIGLGVGGLWSAELLLTFPVIKIFLQGQSLPDYVRQEVVSAQSTHATLQAELERVQKRVAALPSVEQTPAGDRRQRAKLLSDQSTLQRKLNLAAERLAWSVWIEARIVPRLPRDQFRLLQVVFALLLAVTVLKGALAFWQDSIAGSIGERAVVDLRRDLFRKVLKLDPLTVAEVGSARWTAYFTYHLQLVSGGLNELSGRVVREPLKGFACIVAALAINWRLTALSLCVVPVAAWLYHRYGQSLRRATRRAMDSMNRIFRSLEETFENLRAVQLFDRAGLHRRKFHRQNREFYQHSLRIVRTEAMCGPVLELLGLLAVFVALLPAAYLVLHGQTHLFGVRLTTSPMDIAELSVLYTLLAGTLDPLRKFTKFYANFRRTGTVAELIFQHLDLPSRVVDGTGLSQRLSLEESIEFRGVSFEYGASAADSRPILDRVDLMIRAGQAVAIVGANGSGKSTLVNLLPRFANPSQGQILIDGIELPQLRLADLRDAIAWVPQETRLFEGTIADNIRYGRPDATRQEVEEAARLARVLDFTTAWTEGLDTAVGEHGRSLSGGQRQRIALARAIVRQPQILILDEPASAIDAQSEQLIYAALREFAQGRTVLLITHVFAPHVLGWIDEIVVLDRGRVAGQGKYADLAATCPPFQQLVESQRQAA